MKRRLIHAGILAAVFVAAVIVFSYVTNRGNNNMTADLGTATLPSVSFACQGYEVNYLTGYVREMDVTTMRDSITPVTDQTLELHIQTYDARVQSLDYEVFTLDGYRQLSQESVDEPQETVSLTFDAELLTEERLLLLTLHVDGREIYYYTRIADGTGFSLPECMKYISDYHVNAMGKVENVGVGAALEPSGEEGTSFYHVTINSDYDHVSWGSLQPQVTGTERWKITESNSTYTSVILEYQVQCAGEENEQDLYRVKEFFRVRNASGTMYLLDYDRTMEQVFDPSQTVLSEKGILLGITDPEVPYLVSEDGTRVAFIQANELWYYNQEADEMSLLFSFMDSESKDIRNLTDEHEIRLLRMDGNGNVTFAVYGYMNRGSHEGEVGAAIYYYQAEQNNIDEKAFIPSSKSAAVASEELGKLVYYSVDREMLYVLAGGTLYEIDMANEEQTVLAEGLEEGQYVTSDDGQMAAYQTSGTLYEASEVTVMDLETGDSYTVQAEQDASIRPLGFVNADFVCGMSRQSDAGRTVSGEEVYPMYKVEIRSSADKVQRTYQSDSDYVLGVEVSGGMINLERVVKSGDSYTQIASSQITSNEEKKESNISLESYVTDLKETQMRLTFADGIPDRDPKVLRPKQVLYEQAAQVAFEETGEGDVYYVYGTGRFQGTYDRAGDAIVKADEVSGVVVSGDQKYVWERGNRYLEYLITDRDDAVNALRERLAGDASAVDAVREVLGGQILDLTGCTTEEMLYIVNNNMPVVGVVGDGSSVILIGYDQSYVTYIETATGNRTAISYEQMDSLLAGSGRTFISALE